MPNITVFILYNFVIENKIFTKSFILKAKIEHQRKLNKNILEFNRHQVTNGAKIHKETIIKSYFRGLIIFILEIEDMYNVIYLHMHHQNLNNNVYHLVRIRVHRYNILVYLFWNL